MTPGQMAAIHKAAFRSERAWSACEFQDLSASKFVQLFDEPHGFALTRTLAGESELLTLAVDPTYQRQGIAQRLCTTWLDAIKETTTAAFLEVASDNQPALQLYISLGFTQVGQRKAYYARKGAAADALVFRRNLTLGQHAESQT